MNKTLPVVAQEIKEGQLKGRVYLVTGATGGLGKATSLALAKYGATVILTGRNESKLDALYDEIEAASYPTPAIVSFDLAQTEEDSYKQFINSIFNEFKRLDGIVNAACHIGAIGPIGSQDSSEWLKVQQVNVNAAALMSKICLPLLQQSEHASITFISDSSARQSKAYWGAYGVSKTSIESFAMMLADELEDTTVVSNVFIPGPCELPIRKKTHPGVESYKKNSIHDAVESLLNVVISSESGACYTQ
ncbi:MAG: SDR family NAD(P)-dependent oxidoreductase [Cycloclasticus sp.]|nr:SDR family NAD(P)-dependent oxidoreductase [Cycloclasticus sp.]